MEKLFKKIFQSALLANLSNFKHNPGKFLDILLPNTLGSTKFINYTSKVVQLSEWRRRKKLLNLLPPSDVGNFHDKGYDILKMHADSKLQGCIQHCLKLVSDDHYMPEATLSKKKFLIKKQIDLTDIQNLPILEFIAHPDILSHIANYLGMIPVITYVGIWYSPNVEFEVGRSQMYHLDGEEVRQIKCFIPLDIVDSESGPLTILPRNLSYSAYKNLKQQKLIQCNTQKLPDELVYSVVNQNEAKQMVGIPGDVILVDTCQCYHYGSRPAPKSRLLLSIQYNTPFGRIMPIFGKKSYPERFAIRTPSLSEGLYEALFGYTHLVNQGSY